MAVDVLMSRGVPEERILFLNLISSPQGAENFAKRFPKLRVVTAFIDEGLDEKKFVNVDCPCEQVLTVLVVILSQGLATLATDSTPCDTTQIEYFSSKASIEYTLILLFEDLPALVRGIMCLRHSMPAW